MSDRQDEWKEWYRAHADALVLFARRWVSRVADAEDVVQEGFVRFWRSRHRANDPTAYLYACVRSCALNWLKRRQAQSLRERKAALSRPEAVEPLFITKVERDERLAEIEQVVEALPAEQRAVLVMRIWGGLTFPQIAAALEISANTAASRYRYALNHLRHKLAEETV